MRLFLTQGYEATSVEDLTSCLGISRASLYNTFGDKHGLLMESFCCAESEGSQAREAVLNTPGSPRQVLSEFFSNLIHWHLRSPETNGCFFLTLGAELAGTDPEVRQQVQSALLASQSMFETLLLRHGYSSDRAAGISISLLGTMVSLLSLIRVLPDRPLLETLVQQGLKILD